MSVSAFAALGNRVMFMVKNLKRLREGKGISQQKLAAAIGVSQQSVNAYENKAVEPDIDTLIALADYFETSVDFLVGHTPKGEDMELSPDERAFLRGYRAVSEAERESLRFVLRNYLSRQENIDDEQK